MAPPEPSNRRIPSALEISQLHDKPAAQWEKKLRELDEEKKYRVLEYLPIRKAIISELESPGTGEATLVAELDGYNSGFATESMVETMRSGFSLFKAKNAKTFTRIYSENVRRSQPFLVQIGGGHVRVTVHAEVEHARFGRGSLFIYASQYSKAECNALQELLGLVSEQRDGRTPDEVFWLDIRKGTITRLKSRSTVRSQLADTVRHYNRLF